MTTRSTEAAISFSSPRLHRLNSNSLKSDANKFWSRGQVWVKASTDSFWEDDLEEKIKKKVLLCKSIFHTGRSLEMKNLSQNVTEPEIRELLNDFPVTKITVTSGADSSIARAELENPEMLEEWDRDRTFLLYGQCVPVCPAATKIMLCVANLPLNYTEKEFNTLVKYCGEVKRSFLMISEKTGESKGYGFVEYKSKEISVLAKNILGSQQINNHTLVCDWLDSSHVTFESLHSKCLYVDGLPINYCDMSEFRKIFSSIVNPLFCQIALKHGCPQDWGLVEYNNWEDAEAVQTSLDGYNLHGKNIKISYYIPGIRAFNLYQQLLNDVDPKDRSTGLLPEPNDQTVAQNLHNLFKQNPIFALNLQSVIATSQKQATNFGEQPPDPERASLLVTMPDLVKKQINFLSGTDLYMSPTIQQPPSPVTSPPLFLKPTPFTPTKIPLVPNLSSMASQPSQWLRHSPPAGEVAPALTVEGEPSPSYWADLRGQLTGGTPTPVSFPVPPPKPPSHPYNMPPPNFIRDHAPNMHVESHQNLIRLPSNQQSQQQFLTNLHSQGQPASDIPSFTYPVINPMGSSLPVAPPLPRSPLTDSPEPVNLTPLLFSTSTPTYFSTFPQPVFNPFASPDIIRSQASPTVSPQPNPIITPFGQKRRLLPSREPSPESNYVGQHSQGLGGHYEGSYFKRKKKN
ncbi:ribonucleoprotein PTB-binding 1-like [Macrosteles quadrilineatus]|uniref:ribonucleoprotein PTB-binding 1-like n=1 Tax=Macrosteles quadrilineatus TaxID=74068 RepID=UPI0023E0A822|nr:ribonucleoprotein PTB-binding 1-like [Macrosteles quadrilineatus]